MAILLHERRKKQFRVCSDSKQEMILLALFLYRVSCFKANACGSFSSIQLFGHFCLITWPLYSDHNTSNGGVLGTASAQLFSDTWLEFCLSRVKSVLRTGESSMNQITNKSMVKVNYVVRGCRCLFVEEGSFCLIGAAYPGSGAPMDKSWIPRDLFGIKTCVTAPNANSSFSI